MSIAQSDLIAEARPAVKRIHAALKQSWNAAYNSGICDAAFTARHRRAKEQARSASAAVEGARMNLRDSGSIPQDFQLALRHIVAFDAGPETMRILADWTPGDSVPANLPEQTFGRYRSGPRPPVTVATTAPAREPVGPIERWEARCREFSRMGNRSCAQDFARRKYPAEFEEYSVAIQKRQNARR